MRIFDPLDPDLNCKISTNVKAEGMTPSFALRHLKQHPVHRALHQTGRSRSIHQHKWPAEKTVMAMGPLAKMLPGEKSAMSMSILCTRRSSVSTRV